MRIPPPRKPIDPDELLHLREEGLSGAEIARRLGYTSASVRRALKGLGDRMRPARNLIDELWGERLYTLWRSVRQRCYNPRYPLYRRYGARGFSICRQWESFPAFYEWAMAAGYRPRLNLQVVGRSRQFGPRSCRWLTTHERIHQDGYLGSRPQRTIVAFGKSKSAAEWVRDPRCLVSASVLHWRIRQGVPPEKAITSPPRSPLPKDGRRVRASKGPRKRLNWERIIQLHTCGGLAPREIAERIGAEARTIRKGLKARHVWRRQERRPHLRRIRMIWNCVRRRCELPSDPSYNYYGARGARLCAAWRSFEAFYEWAVASGYEPGLCLTRRKGRSLYSARNCFWATRAETTLAAHHPNSRMPAPWTVDAFGESKGPTAWTRDARCQVSLTALIRRLRAGLSPEEAISIPPRSRGKADTLVRPITAFGITKNIADWSRDRRCKVATTVIGRRIARGIPPEVAITTPPYGLPR